MTETPETSEAIEATETQPTPQAGMAQAVGDLSEQTRRLVRQEISVMQRELKDTAVEGAPALALAAAAGALGLAAAASAYRLSLRLLEKQLSPAAAALTATLGYGAAAAGAAVLAARRIRSMPSLFPSETARQAADTARQAGQAVADVTGKAGTPPRGSTPRGGA